MVPANDIIEPEPHVARPELISRTKNLLDNSGMTDKLETITPYPATVGDIEIYHTPDYIEQVQGIAELGGGEAGPFTPMGKDSYQAALLAAGGGMAAVDAVMAGKITNAYGLLRPPGHHAIADSGMGFCLFNNIVIAARYAQKKYGLERILILDWDVHHGNGTEAAFYHESSVLFFSLHQDNNFPPESGKVLDTGEGQGRGFNINIPLPAGTGAEGYLHAFTQIVTPISRQFQPELILISAGQDANGFDPLARMVLHSDTFRAMARIMKDLAEELCDGRLVALHEGGYSTAYVPFCTLAIIEEFSGLNSGVEDPFLFILGASPEQKLAPWQADAIRRVVETQRAFWKL